jgi:5-formyltetrahydrofolate cyclo-ligase
MHMLRLYSLEDMRACPLDKWGILDPGEDRKDAHGPRENGGLPVQYGVCAWPSIAENM